MNIAEELKSADTYPSGPVSAWPQERNEVLRKEMNARQAAQPKIKASAGKMVGGLLKTAGQAIANGRVSEEIRNERYGTCKKCPAFNSDSKRCSECGCFMEAKTWVGGSPDTLCPLKKWSR